MMTGVAVTVVGLMAEIVGTRADTGNSTDAEAPPPGSGLNTKTMMLPLLSISLGRMLTFSCVALTNVVLRNCPPKYTEAPGTKFAPFTCKVKAVSVAIVEGGFSDEIIGTGFVGNNPLEMASCAPLPFTTSLLMF